MNNKELKITVRLSVRESVEIQKAALKRGQTASSFIRWASLTRAADELTEQGQNNAEIS